MNKDEIIEETVTTTTVTTVKKTRKKKGPVEIVVVVDESGSMGSLANDAIGGFNTFLKEQKAVKGKANVTLITFNGDVKTRLESVDVQTVENLTEASYRPMGGTALNDAICISIDKLAVKNPEKAIICILTDGEENSSREYSAEQVKTKIKESEAKGWQVIYLAANQDAFLVGGALGFAKGSTMNFDASSVGVANAYAGMSLRSKSYRTN